ncbi:hypothetical protein C7293_04580 [filamentous cyanobacterium CCT1]|nr:hypothetical protein C7293_04580 [filamentous cyanobacterium CCT1]PSN81575.1 hypothetical protein C8B47_00610 [filamentous cyanobacterium CCP4]
MAFITLLATAVGIVSALGLVIVGLVEAPWQVLLLGLLTALYALQRQIRASERVAQASDIVPDATVASVSAQPDPEIALTSGASPEVKADVADNGYELTYRGIRYRSSQPSPETTPTGSPEGDSANAPANTIEGIYRGQRWQR